MPKVPRALPAQGSKLAEHLGAGEHRYMIGVYRYTQHFLQGTGATNACATYRDRTNGTLDQLTRERAGLATQT